MCWIGWRPSATCTSAKASCRARTRPTSSAIASAASSAPKSPSSPKRADFTVEEVDALTGPLIGLPKSASFRLIDIIGLDVWVHVLRNLYEAAPLDPARELYRVPAGHAADDGARLARRKARPGLLQTRRQRRGQGNLGAGPQDARIPAGAKSEVSAGGRRARHRRSGTAPARAGGVRRSRRAVSVEAVSRLRDLLGAHGAGDLRPHRRTRSRHALGLRLRARAFRVVGRARRAADRRAHAHRRLRDSRKRGAHAGIGRAALL